MYSLCWVIRYGHICAAQGKFGPAVVHRMRVLGLRDPIYPISLSNRFSFGLLNNGCPLNTTDVYISGPGSVVIASVDAAVFANGYHFEVLDGPPDLDPVRWVIEISSDMNQASAANSSFRDHQYGAAWKTVGESAWRGVVEPGVVLPDQPFALPLERGRRVKVDFRPTWQWILHDLLRCSICTVGFFAYVLAGICRNERLSVQVLCCMYALITLFQLVSSVGYGFSGNWIQAVEMGLDSVPDMLVFAVLSMNQRYSTTVSTIFGLMHIAIEV
jgi:hypothetical protein